MKEVITYLNFDGNCRQAMEFYERCLGGKLFIMPYGEAPGDFPVEAKGRIIHATVSVGGSSVLMACDLMPGMAFRPGNNFSVTIQCESREEIETLFASLGENGEVTMPLQDTFWGAHFGMVNDQFGISWMFNFSKPDHS